MNETVLGGDVEPRRATLMIYTDGKAAWIDGGVGEYEDRRIWLCDFRRAVRAMENAERYLLFLFDLFLKERYAKLHHNWEQKQEYLAKECNIHNALEYVETTRPGFFKELWDDFGNWLLIRQLGFNEVPEDEKPDENSRLP